MDKPDSTPLENPRASSGPFKLAPNGTADVRRLAAIVEASRDAIWSWTADGTIVSWNGEAERLFGYKADEIIGTSLWRLIPPERVERAREAVTRLQTGGWFGQYETVRLRKDGTPVHVELTVSPIRDAAGTIVSAATVCRDVTERRQFEESLARRMNELSTLYQFTDSLHRANSPEEVYDSALDAILTALACDRASILLFDDLGVMRFVAWRGLSAEYRKAVDGHSPWVPDAKDPAPICVCDIDLSNEPDDLKMKIKTEGICGLAFMPLVANGRLIGKFMTYYHTPHVFAADEVQLALTIARQVASGVERARAAAREKTLVRELQHRSNNLLAVVQSIATRTLAGQRDIAQASKILTDRLQALGRANRQLGNSNWMGLDLGTIVYSELESFATQAKIDGIKILLDPHYAQSFCLAVHELATNAIKHGALSRPEGKINVSWAVTNLGPEGFLKFRWKERDGPPVVIPSHSGFGTSLLRATFKAARVDYAADGLSFEVEVPMRNLERSVAR